MKQKQNETYALVSVKEHDGNQVVSARELHKSLKTSTNFRDWIKRRIEEYGFVENEDFIVSLKNERNSKGGRSLIEYDVSLDMAKELAMVERTEQGRNVRKYFIEVEKAARNMQKETIRLPEYASEIAEGVVFVTSMGDVTNHVFVENGEIYAKIYPILKMYGFSTGINKLQLTKLSKFLKKHFVGKTECYFINLEGFYELDQMTRYEITTKQLNGIQRMFGMDVQLPEVNVFSYTYEKMFEILGELLRTPVNKNKVQNMLLEGRKNKEV